VLLQDMNFVVANDVSDVRVGGVPGALLAWDSPPVSWRAETDMSVLINCLFCSPVLKL
jgi:hypothetical protein